MKTRNQLLCLLAASSLAALSTACGSGDPEPTQPDSQTESGGEAEAACGGGACGAAMPDDAESEG